MAMATRVECRIQETLQNGLDKENAFAYYNVVRLPIQCNHLNIVVVCRTMATYRQNLTF